MISVIIRSKDEADRLRLCLASLLRQVDDHELIVINDGSTDHTDSVIDEAMKWGKITAIKHHVPLGRSAASNAGADIARGDLLLFMDGDVIASPNLLALHQQFHQKSPNFFARGENRHLRCTRMLQNPELATPFQEFMDAIKNRSQEELERLKVTSQQIHHDFSCIDKRSGLSIYLGIQPQTLFNLEISAIINSPNSSVIWAAASGHNSSISKDKFLSVNGFDNQLDINEQRELAFKLIMKGVKMGYIPDAKSYHMIHQSRWRNPLEMPEWEERFLFLHPRKSVALLNIFWGTIANPVAIPPSLRIHNLNELESASMNHKRLNYDEARILLGLKPLGLEFWHSNFN